jgi:hypothetical protein
MSFNAGPLRNTISREGLGEDKTASIYGTMRIIRILIMILYYKLLYQKFSLLICNTM